MTDAVTQPGSGSAGIWEDFVDIFFQPSKVFERRSDGKFGLALLILVVVSTILYFALRNGLAPVMDAEIAKQVAAMAAKNPNMTAEQISGARKGMEMFGMFGTIIFIPIGVAIVALLTWLAGKLFDAKTGFAVAMMIATYSQVPRVIAMIPTALQGLFMEPEAITSVHSVALGPARFLGADPNPIVVTLLGGLDVFTIWVFVLLAIGVSVVAKVPLKRAAFVAVVVWLVSLLPALYGAISQASA
jgi:hypothetical protein